MPAGAEALVQVGASQPTDATEATCSCVKPETSNEYACTDGTSHSCPESSQVCDDPLGRSGKLTSLPRQFLHSPETKEKSKRNLGLNFLERASGAPSQSQNMLDQINTHARRYYDGSRQTEGLKRLLYFMFSYIYIYIYIYICFSFHLFLCSTFRVIFSGVVVVTLQGGEGLRQHGPGISIWGGWTNGSRSIAEFPSFTQNKYENVIWPPRSLLERQFFARFDFDSVTSPYCKRIIKKHYF